MKTCSVSWCIALANGHDLCSVHEQHPNYQPPTAVSVINGEDDDEDADEDFDDDEFDDDDEEEDEDTAEDEESDG